MYIGDIKHDDSIFVSIASYRDDECIKTVEELFQKAKHPNKIYVGIVQQNKLASEDCSFAKYGQQMRIMTLQHNEARGPCYARYLCSSLWKGETFFFQIDSHTRFQEKWDETLVNIWKNMNDKKVVFAHYPKEYNDADSTVAVNCLGEYQSNGIIRMASQKMPAFDKPRASYWGGANFLFGYGQMIRDVPFDPDLDMLFHGEELLYSARLFTNGYMIYAPHVNTTFHWYGRGEKPKFWNDVEDRAEYERQQKESEQKVKDILGMPGFKKTYPIGYRFGLGNVRTMDEFWNLTGVDFEQVKKNPSINTCNR